jgi:hypothetical protein
MKIDLEPGDIFCSKNPMGLGKLIIWWTKVWAKDNQAEYSHSGIILDKWGTTFEALTTNSKQDFFEAYKGDQVLIGRHVRMTPVLEKAGWEAVKHHEGGLYAGHRLLFFLFPPLAKYVCLGLGVCSELTMKFLCGTGLASSWKGWNPDDVADMIKKWDDYEVVFEGVLE